MRRTIRHADVRVRAAATGRPAVGAKSTLRNLSFEVADREAPELILEKDSYGDKLLRYIPAEVIGFYILAYPFMKDQGRAWQIIVFLVTLVGLLGWLIVRARAEETKPRWWFFLLSAIAFVAWAIGTSTVGSDLFLLSQKMSQFTVMVAVFLVPLIDELLSPRKTETG